MKKIIVADDDESITSLISRIAVRQGFAPLIVSNGNKAWDMIRENPDTAIVIIDMKIPGVNGRILIEKIKNDKRLKHIPVIAVSGAVSVTDAADIMEAGAVDFIKKPFSTATLAEIIKKKCVTVHCES